MAKNKDNDDGPPREFAEVSPDQYARSVGASHQTEMLMEIQRSLVSLETKVERLISDVEKNEGRIEKVGKELGDKIDAHNGHLQRFMGGATAAGVIIAALWAVAVFVIPLFAQTRSEPAPQTTERAASQDETK